MLVDDCTKYLMLFFKGECSIADVLAHCNVSVKSKEKEDLEELEKNKNKNRYSLFKGLIQILKNNKSALLSVKEEIKASDVDFKEELLIDIDNYISILERYDFDFSTDISNSNKNKSKPKRPKL